MLETDTSIGIDLGGTSIKYAVIRGTGEIIWESRKPTMAELSKDEVLQNIIDCAREARDHAKLGGLTPLCVGIGSPGLVDIEKGVIKGGAPQLPDWNDVRMGSIISEAMEIPAFVDNDANMMGFGESVFGSSHRSKNMIFLTIGTNIGGAIIINGELYRGNNYAGSELGAIPMNFDGQTAYWEEFASAGAMVRRYKERIGDKNLEDQIDGHYIFSRLEENDEIAREVVDENAYRFGFGVAGYINIFNPEMVVIGGGVSEAGEFYIEKIRKSALDLAMEECSEGVVIRAATLGNKAGFLGAGYFAIEQERKSRID